MDHVQVVVSSNMFFSICCCQTSHPILVFKHFGEWYTFVGGSDRTYCFFDV